LKRLLPFSATLALLLAWQIAAERQAGGLLPTPVAVFRGLVELLKSGLLAKHVVASLFRVTWGYTAAVVTAVPLGLLLGWHRRGEMAIGPLLQLLRPISPLAWIPISILWFGVTEAAPRFLIVLAAFFPIVVATMNGVKSIPSIYLSAGRNFGLSTPALLRRVVFPAILPQILVGLRIALGIAWLVVVAAEMIAVNSGLGFLIIDARNAGNRYDLVVAGMVMIGLIGLLLDRGMRRMERFKALQWGYGA